MVLYHGTDARAARSILATGVRAGSHVTDDFSTAEHYARRSAGATGQPRGAVIAVWAEFGDLSGVGFDPDAPVSKVWRLRRVLAASSMKNLSSWDPWTMMK